MAKASKSEIAVYTMVRIAWDDFAQNSRAQVKIRKLFADAGLLGASGPLRLTGAGQAAIKKAKRIAL